MTKTTLTLLSAAALLSCSDFRVPSELTAVDKQLARLVQISGPTFLAKGQNGTWDVSAYSSSCQSPWWTDGYNGPTVGYGVPLTRSFESSVDLRLNAFTAYPPPPGVECSGQIFVEVWEGCDPRITNGSTPGYCDAEISWYPDGAAQYETCTWFVVTNMPPDHTTVNWYVDNVWKHTGPEFVYTHEGEQSFEIYMTAEAPSFGARNDYKTIPVGEEFTCNM